MKRNKIQIMKIKIKILIINKINKMMTLKTKINKIKL